MKLIWFVLILILSNGVDAQSLNLATDGSASSYSLAPCFDYVEDTKAQYQIEDLATPALQERFLPAAHGGDVNFGYSKSVFWLRCRLDAMTAGKWLLEIGYPSLDYIQVYSSRPTGGYEMQQSGDLLPFSTRVYPHRNFVFPVEVSTGSNTLFLRIRSDGTLTVPATLWEPYALHQHDIEAYSALSVYYGILIALGIYNLLLYFSLRDRTYLEYVLFVAGMAIGQASLNGMGNEFLWPEWPAWGNVALPVGFALSGLFGALFTRSFLRLEKYAPRLDKMNSFFILWFLISAITSLISYRWGAMMVSLGGLSFSVFACGVGMYFFRREHLIVRYFLLAWLILLIGVGLMGARNFGWLPTNIFTMYAMQIGSSLEMLFLSFALADRIQGLRKEKDRAQAMAMVARQQMVDTLRENERVLAGRIEERTRQLADATRILEISLQQEKNGRETQANLLALMAHEIRSPIAVIGNTAQMLNVLAKADHPAWLPRIDKIMNAVRQLAKLMDNFLAEERLGTKNVRLEMCAGNIDGFCAEIADTLARSYNRTIRFEHCHGCATVNADWQLISIAVNNLIDNAVKYSRPDSEIRMRILQEQEGMLCIEVADQGEGVPQEMQQAIFEKFKRGQHASEIRGVGLGLYLVSWIANIHGGRAEVTSEMGKGSSFRMCIRQ